MRDHSPAGFILANRQRARSFLKRRSLVMGTWYEEQIASGNGPENFQQILLEPAHARVACGQAPGKKPSKKLISLF
jgi:hypothetical protein